MDSSHSRRLSALFMAAISSVLVLAGGVAFAPSASADRSPQGELHSAQGRAHQPPKRTHQHVAVRHSGSSTVSLPRPNGFQAQADPDGMENGGVDQPGGQGGVDPTSQDGNNGSGNDSDCEDDNRGVGVPGHCKDRTPAGDTAEVPESDNPVVATPDQPLDSAGTTSVSLTSLVSGPTGSPVVRNIAPPAMAAPGAGPTILPDTGAAQGLLSVALAGLTALLAGGGLLRRGRRSRT